MAVDLRFIFATNSDLQGAVEDVRFREDLFYRVNVMQIAMPPLRERGDDVIELAKLFISKLTKQLGMPSVPMDESLKARFRTYEWPGNVRELRNLIERSLVLGRFPSEFRSSATEDEPRSDTLEDVERRHILSVLEETGGNRSEAARRLGVSRKTIERKCAAWNA